MLNETILLQAQSRHANHYLRQLKTANDLFQQGEREQAFRKFEADWLQIQRAHSWAVENLDDAVEAVKLCNAYPLEGGQLLDIRQIIPDRIEWLNIAVDAAIVLKDRHAEMAHHLELSRAYLLISETEKGLLHGRQAHELSVSLADQQSEIRALTSISNHLHRSGKFLEARDHSMRSANLSEVIGDKHGLATNYGNLGSLETTLGNYEQGEIYQLRSLEVNREINNLSGVAKSLNNLGSLMWQKGELDKAQSLYDESLRIREGLNDLPGIADVSNNLGAVAAMRENFSLAQHHWQRCLEISRKQNLRRLIGTSLLNLAYVSRDMKAYGDSERYFKEGIAILEDLGLRYLMTNGTIGFGFLHLSLGNIGEAQHWFLKAMQSAQAMDVMPLLIWTLVGIARIKAETGDVLDAAHMAGMIKAHKSSIDSNLRGDLDELISLLEEKLTPEDLTIAFEHGVTLTIDDILKPILG
ncbi:MAG: tetratricopeptide repeat protein [Aggregatilineales bacterium]